MSTLGKANKVISRRGFLKGAAVVGASVAAAGTLEACSPTTTSNLPKWDKTVDVVIVGSGTVSSAAIVAADAGLKVLVLEKAANLGGTTAISGGGMWIPNNYLLKNAGILDSKEEAFKYMKVVSEGASSDELINAYLDKAPEMIEWLRDHAKFDWQRGPGMFADYYPVIEGAHESAGTRLVNPLRADKVGGGKGLMLFVKEYFDAHPNVEVMLETPGKRLVTNDKGEVVGIIATSNGKEIAIRANRGIVLGTGGFDFNKDMLTAYLRGPIYFSVSVPTNTGDGHQMGMAIGADLRNMNSAWGLPGYVVKEGSFQGEADWQMFRGKPGSITVNKHGERFMNEGVAYHPALRAWYFYDTGRDEYRNLPSYALFDSTYTEHYPLPGANYKVGVVPEWIQQADTLEELAAKLGIDPVGLKATVERFNENAKNGVDPDWHRGESDFDKVTAGDKSRTDLINPDLAPIEVGPFYGAAITPGTCGTNGGLRTDANAQVINVWGEPIPGLYATGNTMASVMGAAYPGGGATVGAGMTFGYVAGQQLVAAKDLG
jgi:succinate dehydrogenase/fumarate reductase flavoprotein subunit